MRKINIFYLIFYSFLIGIGALIGMKTGENLWKWGQDEMGRRNPSPQSGRSTSSSKGEAASK